MSEIVFMLVRRRIKTPAKIILSPIQLFPLAFTFIPAFVFWPPCIPG